jgi:hypothetical protein
MCKIYVSACLPAHPFGFYTKKTYLGFDKFGLSKQKFIKAILIVSYSI